MSALCSKSRGAADCMPLLLMHAKSAAGDLVVLIDVKGEAPSPSTGGAAGGNGVAAESPPGGAVPEPVAAIAS